MTGRQLVSAMLLGAVLWLLLIVAVVALHRWAFGP